MMTPNESAKLSSHLRNAIARDLARLLDISEEEALVRHGGGPGWNRKHELGHLLDSATNNRVRFIVAALEGSYSGPTYDGAGWVELGGYAGLTWLDLVDLWERMNQALAAAIERIPEQRLDAACRIASNPAVSLRFLIEDYVLHMQHHLDHIVGREKLTVYPGAAAGI
ncbi:MAG TPA: DinB family protein [Bryobacteraceae bacterium]|jgi:hypothetical protein|nr:DinB family protein [Bryobacteraceae bacterium]